MRPVKAPQTASRSLLLRPIRPRRQPGPFLERPVKRRRLGKPQLLGNLLQRQVRSAQVINRDVAAQLILQLLKTAAFLTQMPTQGLRADVQLRGHGFEVRPLRTVAAEQAAQATAEAVAVVRARQQVGG